MGHMWYIFRSQWWAAPDVSALPMELITRLQMLLKLVMAILFASALAAVCSPMPLLASPLPLWTCVDIFRYLVDSFSGPVPLPVWICSCLLPLLSCMDPAPPDWLVQLSVAPPSSCVDLHIWLARAAVSCAWSNHVAPPTVASHGSVKRQGPPSTHPPASPSQSHALEQKFGAKYFTSVCLHSCVGLLIHGTQLWLK